MLLHAPHIVKNTGDGFLAEFSSAVEAVRLRRGSRPVSMKLLSVIRKTSVFLSA